MTPDEVEVTYTVTIPEGSTKEEEQALLDAAEQEAIDKVLRGLPGGNLF